MAQGIRPVNAVGAAGVLDLAAMQRLGRRIDVQNPATARLAATQMLSELFFKPLLAEARESSLGAAFIDGGQTESIFGERLDQKLADVVAGQQTGLIDEIAGELTRTSWHTRLQAGIKGKSE